VSKIDELIQELCPRGVPWSPLWSETIWDKKFNAVENFKQPTVVKHTYLLSSALRDLSIEGSKEVKLLNTGQQDFGWTTHEVAGDLALSAEIVSIPWGGAPSVQYFKGKYVTSDNRIAQVRDPKVLNTKFLYYFLLSQMKFINSCYRGSGIKHPDMSKLLDFKIPIPPVTVQNEIVEALDAFAEFEEELQAELEARRKQYHFYREVLLGPNDQTGTKWLTVSDLFDLRNGYTPDKSNLSFWEDGSIPWFRVEDIRENGRRLSDAKQKITPDAVKTGKLFEAGNLLISTSASVGEFAVISVPHLANQRFISLRLKDQFFEEVESKYLYYLGYLIARHALENASTSGNFPAISNSQLIKLGLPIPSRERQLKISDQLDLFDEVVNSLETGLPAELVARRKQYEYYRDKLLTFKEVSA
jgi:type I restriction enzyme, S subunit